MQVRPELPCTISTFYSKIDNVEAGMAKEKIAFLCRACAETLHLAAEVSTLVLCW